MKHLLLATLITVGASVLPAITNHMVEAETSVIMSGEFAHSNYVNNVLWITNSNGIAWFREPSVKFFDVEFKMKDGVLICDQNGQSMDQAASNVVACVIDLLKQNGYHLVTKEATK